MVIFSVVRGDDHVLPRRLYTVGEDQRMRYPIPFLR